MSVGCVPGMCHSCSKRHPTNVRASSSCIYVQILIIHSSFTLLYTLTTNEPSFPIICSIVIVIDCV